MLESIMLGELPGTSIQLSFDAWLLLVATALTCILMFKVAKRRIPGFRANYFNRKALKLLNQYHLL